MPPPAFGDRFVLAEVPDGGVLLDLDSGAYYQLAGSAPAIYRALIAEATPATAAARLFATNQLPAGRASREVAAAVDALAAPKPGSGRQQPNRFCPSPGGYTLWYSDLPVLEVDPAGRELRRLVPALPEAEATLLWALPHLMALRGRTTLHGSAVAHRGGVAVLCGRSGLGKTTLARALAARGAGLVSEDLLLLAPGGGPVRGYVGGEPASRAWAAAEAARLADLPAIPLETLDAVASGPTLPVREILFPERASGADLERVGLGPAAALVKLLANSFAEVGDRGLWRSAVAAHRDVAASVPAARLLVPEGLDRMRAAADRFLA